MCTNYTPTRRDDWVREKLGTALPREDWPPEAYPGYPAPIARLDGQGATVCALARFGLVPGWAKDVSIGRRTYNARAETVAEKPSYRTPWRRSRYAIALLDDFFEPDWSSGRAVRWRIRRADGEPMGVASLWDRWADPASGEILESFTMLTVNADSHPVMGRFHRPGDEKRSVVVLEPSQFGTWLSATPAVAAALCARPADGLLTAEPAPRGAQAASLFDQA